MSPQRDEWRERMAKVETKIENIETNVDAINCKLDKFIESADNKYASKLTEKVVYGLVGTVLTIVTTAVLYLIIK